MRRSTGAKLLVDTVVGEVPYGQVGAAPKQESSELDVTEVRRPMQWSGAVRATAAPDIW